jgi:hypothetical protein
MANGDIERTCHSLEAFTNTGQFEIIGMGFLRSLDTGLAALAHTGINALGKTISSPIDGFAMVRGLWPPCFVFAQFTTDQRKRLREKWLGGSQSGDLAKACAQADSLRASLPDAKFRIYLCSTRRVDQELITACALFGTGRGVEVLVVEQSALAHWLAVKPDGQFLRAEYLGIRTSLLSAQLLDEICLKSVERYAIELEDAPWIDRPFERVLQERAWTGKETIIALIGDSGYGKSTSASRLLRSLSERGRRCIRISEDDVSSTPTLAAALDRAMRSIYPTLETGAGEEALRLCAQSPLIVVVDDINRAPDPSRCLERCLSYLRDKQNANSLLILPLWKKIASRLISRGTPRTTDVVIPRFTYEECHDLISSRLPSTKHFEIYKLAQELQGDPYLVGLWIQRGARANLERDLIAAFVGDECQRLAEQSAGAINIMDMDAGLCALGRRILVNRDFEPPASEVLPYDLAIQLRAAINMLANDTEICRFEGTAPFRLRFKHDRLRDFVLVSALEHWLSEGAVPTDVLADPYYAELIGTALRNAAFPIESTRALGDISPLALASAIDARREEVNISHEAQQVFLAACNDPAKLEMRRIDGGAIAEALSDVRSKIVLDVTGIGATLSLTEARFRNGDFQAGLAFCTRLSPDLTSWRDDLAIRDAVDYMGAEAVGKALRRFLSDSEHGDDGLIGAYVMIARGKIEGLSREVLASWQQSSQKEALLPYAIVAVGASSQDLPNDLIPLMEYWRSLPSDSTGMAARESVGHILRLALDGADRRLARALLPWIADDDLKLVVLEALIGVDDPIVMEALIREIASAHLFSPFLSQQWTPRDGFGRQPSEPTLSRLSAIWGTEAEDADVRRIAFQVWRGSATRLDIASIQAIPESSPLFDDAIRARIKLGDTDSRAWLLDQMAFRKKNWWLLLGDAAPIWDAQLRQAVEDVILDDAKVVSSDGNVRLMLGTLLRSIERSELESVLIKCWRALQCVPKFIQLALFCGTPQTRELAAEALRDLDPPNAFRQLHDTYGFMQLDLRSTITREAIDSLIPYVSKIPNGELVQLATYCDRFGLQTWRREHIDECLDEQQRRRYAPKVADLFSELDGRFQLV